MYREANASVDVMTRFSQEVKNRLTGMLISLVEDRWVSNRRAYNLIPHTHQRRAVITLGAVEAS